MEVFLSAYGLSTKEGVALMCLAEALLRVPDTETMDELIRDKIAPHDWSAHSGGSASIFVNASTWALMLTGRVLDEGEGGIERTLRSMVRRLGEPVIRTAVAAAMREMGEQFVLGRTIAEAVKRGQPMIAQGLSLFLRHARRGRAHRGRRLALFQGLCRRDRARWPSDATGDDIRFNPGISVKLSALHPRYERGAARHDAAGDGRAAAGAGDRRRAHARMGLNIDAEEADRLDLSLDVIERVLAEPGACRLGRLRRRRAGLWAALRLRHRLAARAGERARPHASWCGWSRAPTGTPRSSGRRRWGLPAIRCSRARRTPTSPTSPARESCCR